MESIEHGCMEGEKGKKKSIVERKLPHALCIIIP